MTRDKYFDGKVAVVTGAGGTLCSSISKHLAKLGTKVVLVGRTYSKLKKVSDDILKAGGVCRIIVCDVNDEEAVKSMADAVMADWGPCRFLINGAGGNHMKAMTTTTIFDPRELSEEKPEKMRGFFDLDLNVIKEVVSTNVFGVVIMTRVFGRQMAIAGEGVILNFGSMNSYRPLTRVPAYALSKATITSYTQWLAVYFASAGIRVNAVAPGFILNDRNVNYLGSETIGYTERGKNVLHHTPMKRFGSADELLGCVEFLLDDRKASFITGITVPVDGGFLSSPGV